VWPQKSERERENQGGGMASFLPDVVGKEWRGGGGVQHDSYLSDGGVGEGVWCCVGALDRQQHARGGDDGASSARHEAVPMTAKQGRAPAGGERTRWRVGRSGDRKTGWAQEE
jgi:hypothetical protein